MARLQAVELTTALCRTCGETKSREEFHKRNNRPIGIANQCKTCVAEYQQNWRYQSRYGISLKVVEDMKKEQKGLCYICGDDGGKRGLMLDHTHETNEIRKLLCKHCNWAIGHAREDTKVLKKMIDYIEEH